MHSIIREHDARAARAAREPERRVPPPERPEPPPGRLRTAGARALAALAGRLDREAARRAVA